MNRRDWVDRLRRDSRRVHHQAGGLDNVATVLAVLAEVVDAMKLIEAARNSPVGWSQRLGYLLELVDQRSLAEVLAPFAGEHAVSYTPLRRYAAPPRRRAPIAALGGS